MCSDWSGAHLCWNQSQVNYGRSPANKISRFNDRSRVVFSTAIIFEITRNTDVDKRFDNQQSIGLDKSEHHAPLKKCAECLSWDVHSRPKSNFETFLLRHSQKQQFTEALKQTESGNNRPSIFDRFQSDRHIQHIPSVLQENTK